MQRLGWNLVRRIHSSIINLNKNEDSKLEIIKKLVHAELEYRKELTGRSKPDFQRITEDEFSSFQDKSPRQRRRLYAKLRDKQSSEDKLKRKRDVLKEQSRIRKEAIIKERAGRQHIIYGLGHNSLLPRIRRETIRMWRYQRVFRTLRLHRNHIILDCSWTQAEESRAAAVSNLIKRSFDANLLEQFPFFFNLLNLKEDSLLSKSLHKIMPKMDEALCPISIRDESFVRSYPPRGLIYLSPDAKETLRPEDMVESTLVIGALDCMSTKHKFSLKRAKELGIRTAHIPVAKYFPAFRSDTLEIDVLMKVLHEFRRAKDWGQALVHVPKRTF